MQAYPGASCDIAAALSWIHRTRIMSDRLYEDKWMENQADGYSGRKIVQYLLLAFGGAWIFQAAGVLALGSYLPAYTILLALSMFVPLLAVVIASGGIRSAQSGILWKVQWKRSWKWYLAAMFSPLLFVVVGAALYFLLFPADFDPGLGFFIQAAGSTLPDNSPRLLLAAAALQATLFGGLINTFFAVGEEAGWRGYLTPALASRFGRTRGLLLSGVIWGMWHWPIIIFAGYEYGTGYWGAPFSGIAVMCLFTTAFGILLSWLYEKSGSIWVPALAHGAANACAALPIYCTYGTLQGYLLGPYVSGLVAGIPLMLAAAAVLLAGRKTVAVERS